VQIERGEEKKIGACLEVRIRKIREGVKGERRLLEIRK